MIISQTIYNFEWETIIVALIAVFGVLVTTLFGFYQYKHNKWNENISKERTIWLKEFRSEYGKIMKAIAFIELKNKIDIEKKCCNNIEIYDKEFQDLILQAEEARYILITRINTSTYKGNEYNKKYKKLLTSIDFSKVDSGLDEEGKKEFTDLTNKILEKEWQKIKKEVRGLDDEKYI